MRTKVTTHDFISVIRELEDVEDDVVSAVVVVVLELDEADEDVLDELDEETPEVDPTIASAVQSADSPTFGQFPMTAPVWTEDAIW